MMKLNRNAGGDSARLRLIAGATAMAALLSACAGGGPKIIDVGLNRVALDLAFKDEALASASATPPQQPTNTDLPSLQNYFGAPFPVEPPRRIAYQFKGFPFKEPCPTAELEAFPLKQVATRVDSLPATGLYTYHDKGMYDITGPIIYKGPGPDRSATEIRKAEVVPGDKTVAVKAPPNDAPDAAIVPGPVFYNFDTHDIGLGGTYVDRSYQVKPDGIYLVKQSLKLTADTPPLEFAPTLAVRLIALGGGTGTAAWRSSGVDPTTGTAMVVQGTYLKQQLVDVCGKVYDTYRVATTERFVNLTSGNAYVSVTNDTKNPPPWPLVPGPDQPNIYNIAPQYGGLFVSRETHTTTKYGLFVIVFDNVSVLDNINPKPVVAP